MSDLDQNWENGQVVTESSQHSFRPTPSAPVDFAIA